MLSHGLLKYWWPLFQHSKLIGQRTDIFRNVEDAFAMKHAFEFMQFGKVFVDIGSGSSALPTFICRQWKAKTFATELDPLYLEKQKAYMKMLGSLENFHTKQEDATRLTFADSSIDLITAISTIEHIPGDGDCRAMREFRRVLRPGGGLIVTVPTSPSHTEQAGTFYYSGFERRYDRATLQSRLFCDGLRLTEQLYLTSPVSATTKRVFDQFQDVFNGQNPAEVWYRRGWHDAYPDVSILLTLGMIELSETRVEESFGACLAFVRG
jgi:ubiquinone/menaquinone biosynthesis C-methylase UbiE